MAGDLSGFTLGRQIGRGATATVYEALDGLSGDDVAVKIWDHTSTGGTTARDQVRTARVFAAQVAVLRSLSARTDRIVRPVAAGSDDGGPQWLAMDRHEQSLAGRRRRGPLDLDQVATLADDLLHGLATLHAGGTAHGAVKPTNVLITGGRAVLAEPLWTLPEVRDMDATTSGTRFVAPEVARGGPASVQADVFSAAKTLLAIMPADAPVAVERALARAMSNHPHERPGDASALRDLLALPWTIPSGQPHSHDSHDSHGPQGPHGPYGDGLSVRVDGRAQLVPVHGELVIGRSRQCGVVVDSDLISRRHAAIRRMEGTWGLVDLQSTNGLWLAGRRVDRVIVGSAPVRVHLGGPAGPAVDLPAAPASANATRSGAGWTAPPAAQLQDVHLLAAGVTRIGRSPDNDVVLGDLLVSRQHAQMRSTPSGAVLRDLGSDNGTHVNGQAITEQALRAGDLITIGPHLLWFDGARLLEYDETGGVGFGASALAVRLAGGRVLLHDVSFSLGPRTLMAVVGPSGAGKSTLLHALTGLAPATSGTVLYAGRDLYAEYADLNRRIGFVPQQEILHQVLTVEQALTFGARLRFPAETTAAERGERVTEVLAEVSLSQQSGTRIGDLSGGERKRASTAIELLTKPSLLLLDEPTSGLDTDLDRDIMRRLRLLADDGRTVIVVTHNLEHLGGCDVVLVLARGGHVAYLGPPADAFGYFGVTTWADLFGTLKTQEPAEWARRFHAAAHRDTRALPPVPPSSGERQDLAAIPRQSRLAQLITLAHRQLLLIGADRALLGILVVLPAVLALISRVIPGADGLARVPGNAEASQLLLVLVVGACLMGAAGSVRELVKERSIYQRERAVGLSSTAYLASKIVVLTGIAAVQGAALTWCAMIGRRAADDPLVLGSSTLEIAVGIATVSAVSAVIGLLISAIVRDESQAMPLLVLTTMAQLVMCGGLVPVHGRAGLEQLSWLLPSRWGFAAEASSVDLPFLRGPEPDPDPLWQHSATTWLLDMGALLTIAAVVVVLVVVLVRRLDPVRSRR